MFNILLIYILFVDRKTSACYIDKTGMGISVGSVQNGPYFTGNSILLNYTGKHKSTYHLIIL